MNGLELESAMQKAHISVTRLAELCGMNRVTLYRKMASGKFERSEMIAIRDALNLDDADMLRIFFNAESCENATAPLEDVKNGNA